VEVCGSKKVINSVPFCKYSQHKRAPELKHSGQTIRPSLRLYH
jgi:hypothetical protein